MSCPDGPGLGTDQQLSISATEFRVTPLLDYGAAQKTAWHDLICRHTEDILGLHYRICLVMYGYDPLKMGPCPFMWCGIAALCCLRLVMLTYPGCIG